MDLRSCYFCGTVEGDLGTHDLSRDDAEDPVRVTLCPDCRAKLDRVLDAVGRPPFREADGSVDDARPDGERGPTFRGTGEVTFDGPVSAPTDEPENEVEDATGDHGTGEFGGGNGNETRETDGPGDGSDRHGRGDDDPGDGGTETIGAAEGMDHGAADADGSGEGDHESGDAGREGDGSETGDAAETTTDSAAGDGESGAGETGGLRGLDPDDRGRVATYRKALRLLENREFPMERATVLDLMGSAYDLDRSECDRLIDFAVEKGMLVEEGSELRRA